jgi:hypothetical protein
MKLQRVLVVLGMVGVCAAAAATWKQASVGGGSGAVAWNKSATSVKLSATTVSEAGVFSYQEISGDFDLLATVAELPAVGRVALMVREGLGPDARYEMIYVMSDGRVGTDARLGEVFYHSPGKSESPKPLPIRLRAARCGDEIALYVVDAQPCTPPRIRDHATLRGLVDKVFAGVFFTSDSDKRPGTANVSDVYLKPLALTYRTLWLGNSLAGSERGIQQQVQSIAVESQSGRIYLNAHGDEGDKFGGIYSADGDQISRTENSKLLRRSGYGIAVTPAFVFRTCQDQGKEKTGGYRRFFISKTDALGASVPIPNPDALTHLRVVNTTDHPRGLAASAAKREVYVSNTPENEVLVFDCDLKLLRKFPVTRPGAMALAKNGDLWIIERAGAGQEAALCRYTAAGVKLAARGTGLVMPEGIAVAPDGRVWVAESGPRSQFLIFGEDGKPADMFGAEGGVWSPFADTKPGEVHPLKFNRPVGIGFEANGSFVTAAGKLDDAAGAGDIHTTELRKFSADGKLIWERHGLEPMDIGAPQPGTDGRVIYTALHRYEFDGKAPARYAAFTMDLWRHPEDPRQLEKMTGAIVRLIDGQKILFTVANVGQAVAAFRFEKDSEIAIPALLLHLGESKTHAAPQHAPPAGRWLWRDANGDGRMDAGEFFAIDDAEKTRDVFVDDVGGLWITTKAADGGFFYLPCAGLDAHGAPRYDWTKRQRFTPPPPFAEAGRIFYDVSSDTLYIGGFTAQQPRQGKEFKQFGNEVRGYTGWLKGPRTESLKLSLPYVPKGKGGHEAFSAQNLWVAGDFVFTGISASAEVIAYDRHSGALKKVFVAGPEVGGRAGLLDLTYALNAMQRKDGSYLILVESNDQAKILAYEWDGKS